MEHLPLSGGQAPVHVPEHQPLDHTGHLEQVSAFQPLHIFTVAAVPVLGHLHLERTNLLQNPVRLLPVHDGADTDLLAVLGGDHHHHGPDRQFQDIVVPHHAVDLLLNDTLYNSRSVHGMDDLIPDLKQR